MAQKIDTPQLAYPFEISPTGAVREVEQGDIDEIAMSIEIILRYPLGYRDELPDFGIPELSFRESTEDIASILGDYVTRWESRAPLFIEEREHEWDQMVRQFLIRIQGRPNA
jgi:phage baseplate assembly protein W